MSFAKNMQKVPVLGSIYCSSTIRTLHISSKTLHTDKYHQLITVTTQGKATFWLGTVYRTPNTSKNLHLFCNVVLISK